MLSENRDQNSIQKLRSDDPTLAYLLVDFSASRRQLLSDFRTLIAQVAYRNIDPRVIQAVELMRKDAKLTATAASERVCGNRSLTRRIRYWHKKFTRRGVN